MDTGSFIGASSETTKKSGHEVHGADGHADAEDDSGHGALALAFPEGEEQPAHNCNWAKLDLDKRTELMEGVAGPLSALEDDDLEAKQFDLLVLRARLAVLQVDPSFKTYRKRICELASLLQELENVPMVAAEIELILEVQTDEYWQDVTAPILETLAAPSAGADQAGRDQEEASHLHGFRRRDWAG